MQRSNWLYSATLIAALLAAALLAACASPGPTAPKAPLAAPASLGLDAEARTPEAEARWWQAFNDPQLDALVQRALDQQPGLRAAEARLARAQALAEASGAAAQPQVGLGLDATRQRYSENGLFPPPIAGSARTSANAQLGLAWSLDLFGRERAAIDAASDAARAAHADVALARQMLAVQVARVYIGLARLVGAREVAERTLAQRTQMLALVRQRVQAGLDTNVELRQGEGALPDTRTQIEALDEQIVLARHQLAALTAQPNAALDTLRPRLVQVAQPALPEVLGADLLGRRPEVVAARWRVEAAAQDVAGARAQFYPDVNLSAFIGFNSLGLDRLFEAGSRTYGAGPALRLPVFEGGRLRANLKARDADYDAAVAQYNASVIDAVREAADAIASSRSVERQAREQAEALAAAESAYELALQRYRAGIGSYIVVLNAETQLLTQRRLGVDLRARALDSRVALMKSLGGGWLDDTAPRTAAAATTSTAAAAAAR